ncbi:MAG: mechanosensitive ion channel domain-containing protein [Patescibacteria group bacterium]|nr:mechanosensitive ion channel [Patescibacteria group bacterium]
MKKRIIYGISGILIFFSFQSSAFAFISLPGIETIETQNEQSFWETLNEIQDINQELSEKEIDIKVLTEFENKFTEEIDQKTKEIEALNELLTEIEEKTQNTDESTDLESLQNQQAEVLESIETLYTEISALELQQEQSEADHLGEIAQIESEKNNLEIGLEKTKAIAIQKAYAFAKKGAVYFLLLIFTLLFGKIAKRAVRKNAAVIAPKKQKVLIKIINRTVTAIIIILILTLIFSQLLILLPILALVGTGLAFAVRDVILSVLAWFFIGTNKRYKINDLIEINGAKGRVLDIKMIHTTLKETGEKGPTGRILSFPNKKIFEDHLYNLSSMFQLTWVIFDFLLEKGSDVKRAKELLMESVSKIIEEDSNEIEKNLPSLTKEFGINEDTIKTQIFTEITTQGIHIKTKFLVKLSNRHKFGSQISDLFLEKIKDEPKIRLRFLER